MKRSILFIPSRPYRSDPSFIQLSTGFREKGYHLTYIDFNSYTHQFHAEIDEDSRKSELLNYFDDVILVDGRKYEFNPSDSKLLSWSKLRKKASLVKQTLHKFNPLAIIVSFNQGLEFNTIVKYAHNRPLIFLQTVAIGSELEEVKQVNPFRKRVYNLFDINIYPQNLKSNFYQFLWVNKQKRTTYQSKKEGIFYMGNPLYDSILKSSNRPNRNKWQPNSIGYITQPVYEEEEESKKLLRSFVNLFVKNNDYSLKILVHPRDSVPFFNKEFAKYKPDVRYSSAFNYTELAETICITYSSVYAQELIARGIPVIIINPGRNKDYTAIFPKHYPFVLSKNEDISVTWSEINTGKFQKLFWSTREDFIKEVNTYTDGNSSKRIVEKIVEIVST